MTQPADSEPLEPEAGQSAAESPDAAPRLDLSAAGQADQPPRRPVRWQWSLLTLLLLMAVVGSWSAWFQTQSQNNWYRRQINVLQDLAGELVVYDPGRIAAVEVPPMWHSEQRWKVYLPEGHNYRLKVATAGIGERQFPSAAREAPLVAGQHVIALLEADQRDSTVFSIEVDGERVWPALEPVRRAGNNSIQGDTAGNSQHFPLDRPLVLKRLRYVDDSQPRAPNTPMQWSDEGLLLWIEAVP